MGLYTVSPAFIFIKTPWKPREDLYTEANSMPLLRAVSFAAKATADMTAHTRPNILINQL